MTKKHKEARENVLRLCDKFSESQTQADYHNYVIAVDDFKYRFKYRLDPLCLVDEYYLDDWLPVILYQKYMKNHFHKRNIM